MSGTPSEEDLVPEVGSVGASLPVGSIVAYVGQVPGMLDAEGWLECDGRTATRCEYPELWETVNFNFGKVDDARIYLPDLRGMFIRSTCADPVIRAQRDPDWEHRRPSKPSGNSREKIGSVEPCGTAPPRSAFQVEVRNLNIKSWRDDAGCASRPGKYTNITESIEVALGGDKESRPVNKYVFFMVKATTKTKQGGPTRLPIAAVVPYAGPRDDPKLGDWILCAGQKELPKPGPFAELFEAIKFCHGQDGEKMVLPDFQGWFLRGVSGVSRRDPESERRKRPYEHGNEGDNVGSQQGWATALPFKPFSTTFACLPRHQASERVAGGAWDLLQVNYVGQKIAYTCSGGDTETRPTNVSVDFYVRYLSKDVDDEDDGFPIGAVAHTGWDLPENKHWLPCDGRLDVRKEEYPALYDAIGNTYGGQTVDPTFGLPDYRGRFLRGVDDKSVIDPDASHRTTAPGGQVAGIGSVQSYATGRPHLPYEVIVPYLPIDKLGAHGATNTSNAGADGNLTIDPWTSGGDGDTRPVNCYLNFYIRAK